ncbi:MAG TPA: S8 family serine peptidase [Lysobacter sp.]
MAALAAPGSSALQQLFPTDPPAEPEAGPPRDETPQRWFVELSAAPESDGGNTASLQAEKNAFREGARAAGVKYRENFAYSNLFNGLSLTVTRSQLSTVARLPGVKAIYPVEVMQMPDPVANPQPDLATALSMTGADIAQNELGLDGRGIRVAVMDTGLDIDHPDLGGNGTNHSTAFPTARVVKGWDFVGDAFNADPASPTYNPVATPDNNPDDCNGHGTHVAGIIGANGVVKGVAPKVKFGAYRVFGCEGSTTADIMIAAMERADHDGMDVLNMSIGSTYQWPDYPTAKAASRLVNKGIVVVASAGNSGATGMYSTGAPSTGERVISVASFDNISSRLRYFTASPDGLKVGFNQATGSPLAPSSGTLPMARVGTAASTDAACNPLPAGSLAGQAALVRRGTCSFFIKATNAQAAGAAAVVLYDNIAASTLNPTVAGTPSINIPVVGTTKAFGDLLDGRLAGGPVELTWTSGTDAFPNVAGGYISSFSAYGLSPDLVLKPDIGAPGGSIYSTYPLESGGYASISGTSMASPHVAGAAALLLQSAPNTNAKNVGRILQNSAVPKNWSLNPGTGLIDNVHRQGAGLLRIDDAVTAAVRIEPGKLSMGEGTSGPVTHAISLKNTGKTAVTYTLSSVNAVTTGPNTFTPTFFAGDAGVTFYSPTVTLTKNQSVTIPVTITPSAAPVGGQYGGYLVFTPNDGSPTLRVPFAGYIGDYQLRQVLVPTANGFPWLAKLSGGFFNNQPAGASYTMVGDDIPFFLVHHDHQAREMRLDVYEAGSGKLWYTAYKEEFLGRNSTSTGFFAYSWDGITTKNKNKQLVVPNGSYVLRLYVLKALGDENNPAHWEQWQSPVVTIARP